LKTNKTGDDEGGWWGSGLVSGVLLIRDMLQPDDKCFALVAFLNREVRHGAVGSRAVPVLLAGLDPDRVAGMDFLDGLALELDAPHSGDDMQRLSHGMRVPCGAGAGCEGNQSSADAGGSGRGDDFVDPDCSGKVRLRALAAAAHLVGDDLHESIVVRECDQRLAPHARMI
jgi:hypothetical protein